MLKAPRKREQIKKYKKPTSIAKKNFFIILGFSCLLLTSACSDIAFDNFHFEDAKPGIEASTDHDNLLSSDEVRQEIETFSEKLAEQKIKPQNADHIVEGLKALSENQFVIANQRFQRALKFDPLDSHLHMLNAIAHQMRGAYGDPEQYKLAEVGYELASRIDPGNSQVAYYLGIMNFNQQQYQKAQNYFVQAVSLDSENPRYYAGLAASSYYLGELDRAYSYIEKALALTLDYSPAHLSAGIIYASMGDFKKAELVSKLASKKNSLKQKHVLKRVSEWEKFFKRKNITKAQLAEYYLAQNLDIFGVPKAGMFNPQSTTNNDPLSRQANPNGSSAPSTPVESEIPSLNLAIPAKPNNQDNKNLVKTEGGNIEAVITKSPSKSKAAVIPKINIPKMALVDVAIIRTEEIYKSSKGVNLLNGLNLFFTGDQIYQRLTPGLGQVRTDLTTNDTITLKLGTAGAGLTYSLNIFSDGYDRNEIIARPTILVEDKKKSTFFSGGTMHIVLEGGVAGSGSVEPINTGVNLEVTPNFLDSETLNMSIFAQRVFLESSLSQVSSTITGTSFATSHKTAITSNLTLRYGETMVLSGLSDQEKEIIDDKVPGVGDVPGIQYVFRNQVKTSSKKTVLILLTPRRASLSYEDGKPKPSKNNISGDGVNKLENSFKWMQPAPHLSAFVKHLGKYEFFNHYRKGDMQLENWAGEGTINDAIWRTLEYLYIKYGFEKSSESSL